MILLKYPTKKELKNSIGEKLRYSETSIFGQEDQANGTICGCNRPHLTGYKREFFAQIEMVNGKIASVS